MNYEVREYTDNTWNEYHVLVVKQTQWEAEQVVDELVNVQERFICIEPVYISSKVQ